MNYYNRIPIRAMFSEDFVVDVLVICRNHHVLKWKETFCWPYLFNYLPAFCAERRKNLFQKWWHHRLVNVRLLKKEEEQGKLSARARKISGLRMNDMEIKRNLQASTPFVFTRTFHSSIFFFFQINLFYKKEIESRPRFKEGE